jgi:hypothetical protein
MRNLPVERLVLACARFRFSPPREEMALQQLGSEVRDSPAPQSLKGDHDD